MRTTLCSSTCWGWRNVCGQKAQVRRKLTWNVGQFVKKEKHAFCLSLICLCTLHYLCYILDPLRNCFMHYFWGENYWSPNHVIGKNIGFCEEYTLAGHLCFLHVRRMIKMPRTTMLLANLPFKNKFFNGVFRVRRKLGRTSSLLSIKMGMTWYSYEKYGMTWYSYWPLGSYRKLDWSYQKTVS